MEPFQWVSSTTLVVAALHVALRWTRGWIDGRRRRAPTGAAVLAF